MGIGFDSIRNSEGEDLRISDMILADLFLTQGLDT